MEYTNTAINPSALFRIQYGLYCLTTNDGTKDNGCIVNTPIQVTSSPQRVAVTVSKLNYTCDIIGKTEKLNINCLSADTPFEVFKNFGYQSGRDFDKLAGYDIKRSANGLCILSEYANAYMSLEVEQKIDLGSHVMFICGVKEADILSDTETMTYEFYQKNVKPKPEKKKGFVCRICGHVYEGDSLPQDYICPICKHGAADFEPM